MDEVCVRVAVRIRPLLPKEVLHRHQVCVRVVPGSTRVVFGLDRLFSFDHAFGPTASQDEVYEASVRPLVEYLINGYNATVFCYGQTGSGKTYTLGGGNQDEEGGIIDRVAQDVFLLLEERSRNNDYVEAKVRVSYIELYKEELRDLLELNTNHKELRIRDDERGNTVVVGAKEIVITSGEELLRLLEMGNALRHTDATGMNEHSSRSHTIITLQVNICRQSNNNSLKSSRSSKLCLVDLAGSEHAGKTGNTGTRLKETAHINTGLLALGKVIRALSDPARIRRGNNFGSAHIPYRDAKITRLLRDSLGGASHTLMVACVSPSHHFDAETLNVLQFASKACHIRNCPRAINIHTEVKCFPATWHPNEARLGELEFEVQTLRELLKDKEKDTEMETGKAGVRAGEESRFKQSSHIQISKPTKKVNQDEEWQYCLLAKEAAGLLSEISGLSPSLLFREQVRDWHERLTAVCLSAQTDKDCVEEQRNQPHHVDTSKPKVHKCQKDAELKKLRNEVEKLLQERSTHLKACEEAKERSRLQTEQLVSQQILIERLRSSLLTLHGGISGPTVDVEASGFKGNRPHSVPLTDHSCAHQPPRKIHSSPPAYSLERVMAAFKMRGRLLLAEIDEKDEVYCPFNKQQIESKDRSQEEKEGEEDSFNDRGGFRRSLNRTWTSRHKKLNLKEKDPGLDPTLVGNPVGPLTQRTTDVKGSQPKKSHTRKPKRASAAERKIHDLSVNMHMKEELITELDRTEKETRALDRDSKHSVDGRDVDVLARLSMQSQRVRAEAYRSLQHMRLQRAQLLGSLDQLRETGDGNKDHSHNLEQSLEDSTVCKGDEEEESNRMLHDTSWMEEEEEKVLQKRAELQELEEELKRREDVLLRREACLQQKNKLEMKMLRSSQALNQDLLHVSTQLKSVEEQLQSSSNLRESKGLTIEELEKERDMLKKRRDTLDVQLRDNRVLTVEEEHCLLQLEEAIEALDAALEFKNDSIKNKQQHLSVDNSFLHQSQSTEPAQLCDVTRKLKDLSPPEAFKLLLKYFNKVVCLREAERVLRLRCEELELHAGEQEAVLRKMEAAMHSLVLDADRRLTQQHRDHQNNIQLLLQKLKEGISGEAEQPMQDRLQHLEKELFFYKTSTRQLKQKLKELLSDAIHPENEPSCTQKDRRMHNTQTHENANKPLTHFEEVQTGTQISTYTKIYTERDTKTNRDSSLSRQIQQTTLSDHNNFLGRSVKGQVEEISDMLQVRLCRRDIRQIPRADLHVSGSATRGQQSVVDISSESVMEDSIEVLRNTDR
ncbi:kinesin-like protein KIF27 [Xenentodon cancila]